jgi:hypothetical protein
MAKPALDRPGVVPLIREGVTAGVAEHVRVRLDLQASASRSTFDHPGEPRRRERRTPLADGDERRWRDLSLEPPQRPQLVARIGWGSVSRS